MSKDDIPSNFRGRIQRGTIPKDRCGHKIFSIDPNFIIMFGGHSKSEFFDSYKFENTEDGVFCYDSITDVWKKMNVVGDPDVYIRSQFAACVNQQERTIYFTAGVIVSYNGKIIIVNV